MNRKQKIYAACKEVERGANFSCLVLRRIDRKLAQEYQEFLGAWWPWDNRNSIHDGVDCKMVRILCLLLFLEAGDTICKNGVK